MSNTIRNIISGFKPKIIKKGGDAQVNERWCKNRKMTPYSKSFQQKFINYGYEYGDGYMKRISRTEKLITKNANRSLKKGVRFKMKIDLKKQLENGEIYNL